jgi:hypothetical protein
MRRLPHALRWTLLGSVGSIALGGRHWVTPNDGPGVTLAFTLPGESPEG